MGATFYIALFTFIILALINIQSVIGLKKIKHCKNMRPLTKDHPKVSIILTALNEEDYIAETVKRLMNIDYPNLEMIIVNDRSTDNTGHVLNELQQQCPHLKTYHIDRLPEGWLGKNHAMQKGSEIAEGEYLLFIDADTLLESTTLSRAMQYVLDHELDHLTSIYQLKKSHSLINAVIEDLTIEGFKTAKPWLANNPQFKNFVGNGKFNLLKTSAYRAIEGHQKIKLCVVDDQMLGMHLKWAGFKQDVFISNQYIIVDWYTSIKGFIKGVEKHIFPSFAYSVPAVIVLSFMGFMLHIFPLFAIFLTDGLTQLLNIVIVLMRILSCQYFMHLIYQNKTIALMSLVTPIIGLITLWNSTYQYIKTNGIVWKGTHYQICALKQCKLPKFNDH